MRRKPSPLPAHEKLKLPIRRPIRRKPSPLPAPEQIICAFSLAKNNEGSMLVERSMLTMRIERSICPLTMLVERSMLTMRIERSICPLTRWMFATILVRRRLWSFLERLNLSQYWTLPNDFRMISYFRDEAEKVTTDPHDYPASVDGQGAARYTVPPGRRL